MASAIEISHQPSDAGGMYEARVEDSDATGVLTYQRQSADTIVADHTLVPDALRGRGIASALVKRLVADAREQGVRIVPACSFVRVGFERHPEWADVKAD